MKRILIAWLIASSIGLAETYVLPTRTDLNLVQPNYSLPFDTYTNSTTWLTGQLNGDAMTDFSPERTDAVIQSPAAVFNGSGDYVSFGTTSLGGVDCYAGAGTAWTSTQWIKADYNTHVLGFGRGIGTTIERPHMVRFARYVASTWTPVVFINGLATPLNLGLDDGKWHQYVISWDGTTCKMYVDGGFSANLNVGANSNYTHPWEIGRMETTYGLGSASGCSLYSRALSSNEVAQVYGGAVLSGCVFNTPLQEGSGTTIYDVSTNGNHGTATIASSEADFWGGTQTNSPYFAENGGSKVLRFDGVGAFQSFGNIGGNLVEFEITFFLDSPVSRTTPVKNLSRFAETTPSGNSLMIGASTATFANEVIVLYSESYKVAWTSPSGSIPAGENTIKVVDTGSEWEIWLNGLQVNNESSGAYVVLPCTNHEIGKRHDSFSEQTYISSKLTTTTTSYTAYAKHAYKDGSGNIILPDSVGSNDASDEGSGVEELYIPALSSGTNDAEGLGITNPKGLAHNNGGYSLIFGGTTNTYANLLTNSVNIATNAAGLITEVWE